MKKNKIVLYSGIGVITAAVLAGSAVVLQHSQTNHLSDICPVTKIESFFLGEEIASKHQKKAIKKDAEDLGYSLIDVKYIPEGGVCATVLDIPTEKDNTLKSYYVDSEKYTVDGKNFVTTIFSDEHTTIEDTNEQQLINNLTVKKDITVGFDGNVTIKTGFIKLKRK